MRFLLLLVFLALGLLLGHAPCFPQATASAAPGPYFAPEDEDDDEGEDDDEEEDDDDGEDDDEGEDDDDGEDDDGEDDQDDDNGQDNFRPFGGNFMFGGPGGFGGGGGGRGGAGGFNGGQNGGRQNNGRQQDPGVQKKDIDVEDLPEKVAKAVQRAYPNGKLKSAEEYAVQGANPKYYGVLVETAQGKQVYVSVSPKGVVLRKRIIERGN